MLPIFVRHGLIFVFKKNKNFCKLNPALYHLSFTHSRRSEIGKRLWGRRPLVKDGRGKDEATCRTSHAQALPTQIDSPPWLSHLRTTSVPQLKEGSLGAVLALYEFPLRYCGPEESRGGMGRTTRIEKERPQFAGAQATCGRAPRSAGLHRCRCGWHDANEAESAGNGSWSKWGCTQMAASTIAGHVRGPEYLICPNTPSALHGTKTAKFAHNTWWGSRRQWESENYHSPPKRYQWWHAQQGKLVTPPPQPPPQTYKAFIITNLARPSQVPSDKLVFFHSEKSFTASRHCEHRVQMVGSDRAYMVSIIRNVLLWTSFTYYIFLHC